MMDSSGLYEVLPLGSWWASLRSAASVCVCGACPFSWCRCQSSAFYTPVCRCLWILNMSNVMGLILFRLNPMSFSLKDLSHENEPDLFMCGCLLSPCMITCISLLIELTSSLAVWMILVSIFLTPAHCHWGGNLEQELKKNLPLCALVDPPAKICQCFTQSVKNN